MRLTCPNCGAQYEVPDAVIPASGRDVQCSNCGNTWFQQHPDHSWPEPEPDDARISDREAEPEPRRDAPPRAPREPEPPPATQRRLDPEVADILRQEAERERAARAAEAGSRLETQPELGLDNSDSTIDERIQQARTRMERLRGGPLPQDAAPDSPDAPEARDTPEAADETGRAAELDPPSRRNLFPDIDEINSSLTADKANGAGRSPPMLPEEGAPGPRASGFRIGFRLAVIACVLALIVYLMAPRIAVLVPAAEAALAHYVAAVDSVRAMLNQGVASLLSGK